MRQLIHKFFNRLIDYIFYRPRTFGPKLIGFGVAIILATMGVSWLAKLSYRSSGAEWSVAVSTGDSVSQFLSNVAYGIGVLLIVVGLVVYLIDFWRESRKNSRQIAIVVELRGLHSSPDTPAKDADLGPLPSNRNWVLLDFRPSAEGERVSPKLLLQKLATLKSSVETLSAGRDSSDVSVAVGGLAAVPALFLAGMLLEDESRITIYDWDRNSGHWRGIDGLDDGLRTLPLDVSELTLMQDEVVLAVSLSYPVDIPAVRKAFPGISVSHLQAELLRTDVYWSEEKQRAIAASFRNAIQQLMEKGIRRIHLILASPASLAIRLGTTYDERLMPELLVYQYERTDPVPYPWAVRMPDHGSAIPSAICTLTGAPI